ncbi:hypothetical protein O9Z70_08720 [Devosia sp. YIM 151766]|uniref:hypothetical protein n=1 Tax=Devosia sp. YIM 151766 TaxID=3017325 RepID=UPI00255C55A5|nr:hypothetical protein [Devosia sp. YIM 151766]WIY51573.1 hypothetical protein O9Z70_08720 [Devosia sp. YIM 151766]
MTFNAFASRRLPTLAAACLIGVVLPATPALSQDKSKIKTKAPAPAALEIAHSVSIPHIDTVDSNLSEDVLSAILSGAIAEHADALAGLDATSITVPEIVFTLSSQRGKSRDDALVTFSDLVLTDVTDGVAGSVTLGGIAVETDKTSADFGTMSAANFNIGGMLGLYGLVDAAGRTEFQTIYTDFTAAGGNLETDETSCAIGAAAGAWFKARPLQTSFIEIMALTQALEDDPDDLDPALLSSMVRIYADILTAFETSEMSFDGLSCSGVDDEDRPLTFDIAGLVMDGMSPGIYPAISMDGFSVVVEGDGAVTLDNLTIKQADLGGVIATLETVPDNVDETWFEEHGRALIPSMEGLSFAGLSIDIPDPDNADERIQASVGAFDLTLGEYLNGIPTDLDISATNIQAVLPENGDDTLEQLRALGITDIDFGFRLAGAWNEADSIIDIEEVSFTGVDLVTLNLAGIIANATADLFALDENAMIEAGRELALKAIRVNVADAGLADLVLAIAAAEQGGDPARLRPIYADLAKGTVISLLAGVADAAKLGDAVAAFVSGSAKTLEIGITAKDEPGLDMADFLAAEKDPASLLGKVNISATAK